MQVGEVRAAEDADFERLRTLCTIHDGWRTVSSWRCRHSDAVMLFLRLLFLLIGLVLVFLLLLFQFAYGRLS